MSNTLRDELVALTCDLIPYSSVAERPDQLVAVIDYAEGYLRTIPNLHIQRSSAGDKPALVATLRETRSPKLFLNAHLDVVAARPEQYIPEMRDGRIYGRASQDMKGSAAVLLRMAKDLAALDNPPDVGFQFVSDEEIGGALGTNRLLNEGWLCDFFITLEPTDLNICYAHKGSMWAELYLPGVPAHGSRPWAGVNPMHALAQGLAAVAERFPTPTEEVYQTTVTPTHVRSDEGSRNRVPSGVTVTFDIRYVPEDRPDVIMAALRECFPNAQVLVDRSGEGLNTDPNHPALRNLAIIAERHTGRATGFYREHFGTDARFYSAKGIPAICFGPIGAGLHSDEEWVDIESLVTLYNVLMEVALS
jgi:succinyl-diaminopimelate desuccinylase